MAVVALVGSRKNSFSKACKRPAAADKRHAHSGFRDPFLFPPSLEDYGQEHGLIIMSSGKNPVLTRTPRASGLVIITQLSSVMLRCPLETPRIHIQTKVDCPPQDVISSKDHCLAILSGF
jgi:hypothetical protein